MLLNKFLFIPSSHNNMNCITQLPERGITVCTTDAAYIYTLDFDIVMLTWCSMAASDPRFNRQAVFGSRFRIDICTDLHRSNYRFKARLLNFSDKSNGCYGRFLLAIHLGKESGNFLSRCAGFSVFWTLFGDTLTTKHAFLCQGKISRALSQNDLSV